MMWIKAMQHACQIKNINFDLLGIGGKRDERSFFMAI